MPLPITATCNMNCVFCDKVWSKAEFEDVDVILDKAPMSELGGLRAVLGGGEPTLHPKLPHILEGLRSRGVRKLSMRTNGAWASKAGPVQFLRKVGLREVALLFPTHDPALFDTLTRKTGAYDAVMKGVENLVAARVRIVARVPLIQPTLATIQDTLQALPTLLPGLRRIDLVHLDIDDASLQVDYAQINAALPFGSKHPWGEDFPPIHLDPGAGIPMCLSHSMDRWTLSPDIPTSRGHHPKPCQSCFVRNACPGISRGLASTHGFANLRPVPMDFDTGLDTRRRKRKPTALANAPFEPVKGVTYECGENGGESTLASVRLRVGHECNRRCEFCFIPHHEKAVHDHDIPESIQAAVDAGARELVMTGGEPTLVRELPDYIDQASRGGVRRIVLQTNAMRLADPDFSQKLADSGLTSTVISLHSHRDEVLSKITGLPKTTDRILRGIRNLHDAGIQASVTHVIGPRNHMHMPDFVRFMVEEAGLRRFCFIFATPMAWPMARQDLIVRYSHAAPNVMAAMDYCIDNDVVVDGLAFKCGAPHCVVGGDPRYLLDAVPIPDENRTPDWLQLPACQECSLQSQCYGVRRLYAWMYGIDEFKPVLEDGKLAEDWNRGRYLARRPHPVPEVDPIEALLDRVRTLDLEVPELTESVFDEGFRVRVGDQTMGSLATRGDLDEARRMAQVTTIQNRAAGVELGGAHGVMTAPAAEYLAALSSRTIGRDHLLPHTSTTWSEVLAEPELAGVEVLRRGSSIRMASVHSAVAAASAALVEVGGGRLIRTGIWGYGRAGRHFAKLFDGVVLDGGRRPQLVACADTKSSVLDPRGLEFERMAAFKVRHDRLPRPVQKATPPDALFDVELDLLLLSGRGPALDLDTAETVNARVVIDMTGAIPVEVEAVLARRGVVFVPSLLATCGPIILADLERLGLDQNPIQAIASRTADVYAKARSLGGPMSDALLRLALDQSVSGNSDISGASEKGTSPRSP